eukprot:1159995-Pelagomonas_calceolata.AAC.5
MSRGQGASCNLAPNCLVQVDQALCHPLAVHARSAAHILVEMLSNRRQQLIASVCPHGTLCRPKQTEEPPQQGSMVMRGAIEGALLEILAAQGLECNASTQLVREHRERNV